MKNIKGDFFYNILIIISIFLFGLFSLSYFSSCVIMVLKRKNIEINSNEFILFIFSVIFLIGLVTIKIEKKYVTVTFYKCITLIGIIEVVYSLLYWRVAVNQNVIFQIFYFENYFYINGVHLMIGIAILVFSRMLYSENKLSKDKIIK